MPLKILIAGEGGQGVQALSEILAMAVYKEKLDSSYIPNFGIEQRGGISLAFVQIGKSPIPYPKFQKADILAILCERALKRVKDYLKKETKIINGMAFLNEPERHGFSPKTYNMFILGILIEEIAKNFDFSISKENIKKAVEERFLGKPKEILEQNRKALLLGRSLALRMPKEAFHFKALPVSDHRKWPPMIFEDKDKKVTIYPNLCKSCGFCLLKCPKGALSWNKKKTGIYGTPLVEVDIERCIACKTCEIICPDCAIFVKKKKS